MIASVRRRRDQYDIGGIGDAGAAAADPGTRGQCHGQRQSDRDRGIRRVPTTRQHLFPASTARGSSATTSPMKPLT